MRKQISPKTLPPGPEPILYTAIPKTNKMGMNLYENILTGRVIDNPPRDTIFERQTPDRFCLIFRYDL